MVDRAEPTDDAALQSIEREARVRCAAIAHGVYTGL